ncbi:MAG: hypothetical protein IJJ61_05830 [Clostridia bacterium]|nr:hypothetical protein [Clostridia bacterium]
MPDESSFCPYCMDKFDNKAKTKKSNKTAVTIIIILSLLVLTAIIIKLLMPGENNTVQSTFSQARTSLTTDDKRTTSNETATAEIEGKYYEPGTYYWNINGEGEIVLEDFENYPF